MADQVPVQEERRQGDRRQSDRRAEPERNSGSLSLGGGHARRRTSFFDHPGWVAGAVIGGIAFGMAIMAATTYQPKLKRGLVEISIPKESTAKTTKPEPAKTAPTVEAPAVR